MALKAPELHKVARSTLGPVLEPLGFRRLPKTSVAAWLRKQDDQWLMLHVQPSSYGSAADGSQFTIELLLTRQPVLYASGPSVRLPELMTDEQRERLRRLENRVIAKLPPPDPAVLAVLGPDSGERYLSTRKPRFEPYPRGNDIWFRYLDADDAIGHLELCREALPDAIAAFLERVASSSS